MKTIYNCEFSKIDVEYKVCIVTATKNYIPIKNFKILFDKVELLIDEFGLEKLVFDKRNLRVFHQPSMEWYFVEWKERVYEKGLHVHRKILPRDSVFRECVKLGREKIYKEYPNAKFNLMDIAYANSVSEAIAN